MQTSSRFECIGKAKVLDPKIVRHLMRFLLHASGAVRVPDACADRRVMDAVIEQRKMQQAIANGS